MKLNDEQAIKANFGSFKINKTNKAKATVPDVIIFIIGIKPLEIIIPTLKELFCQYRHYDGLKTNYKADLNIFPSYVYLNHIDTLS